MSLYTTGEMAKLAGVSVRTVQFYHSKGILPPPSSVKEEGGCTPRRTWGSFNGSACGKPWA